jgi:hypothetical protein
VYLAGWLLWVRSGSLVAQRLDLERKALTGDVITLAEPVAFDANTSISAVSVSAAGLLAYRTGAGSRRQLAWFDRSGKPLGTFGERDENGLSAPSVSSDGRRVVLYRTMQGNADIWLADALRATRFTFDAALDRFPVWSPDGSRVVFDSNRNGKRNLYQKASSGAGGQWQVSTAGGIYPRWRNDGQELYYLGPRGEMMAASIVSTAAALTPGAPVVLFPTLTYGGGVDTQLGRQYDVTRDGRFLLNTVLDDATTPITVLMNWNPAAKK